MTPPHQAARRALRPVILLGLLLLTVFWTGAGTASAHAELTGAAPSSGSSLSQAPTEVNLQFSETIQDFVPTVTVTGPDGQNCADGAPILADNTLTQPLAALGPPGVYTAAYRIVSADDHPVTGETTFPTFAPPPPATTAEASPDSAATSNSGAALSSTPSVTASADVDAAAAFTSGGSDTTWHWVWFALLGGALLMVVGIPLLIRRPR